jgi:tetratricopeptide (TPR) repeat protein
MSRWVIALGLAGLAAGLALAQDSPSPYGLPPPYKPPAASAPEMKTEKAPDKSELPPEEDTSTAAKVYSFNPVQSQREVTAGNFYFNKGNYTAAASRYEEATKWNDGNAEAWMRLGEAQEKKSNPKAAREAYQKYLELAPDAKNASEIKKRLAKLKG